MAIGLLGRNVGMTQIFEPSGEALPVTVIEAGPCHVLQVRTLERDGYEAVQLGFLDKRRPRRRAGSKPRHAASRSERGHVAKLDSKRAKQRAADGIEPLPKADCEPKRFIREFRALTEGISVGQVLGVDTFAEIKAVDVIGISKGRGFAGVVKRHHFRGGGGGHGSMFHRAPGSIGASSFPSRVLPGMRMAGHMGHERVTVRNLEIIDVDTEDNVLVVKGAVPGPNGGYVVVRRAKR